MKVLIKQPKVIIAMSGGVDSSVAAALLKKQGYNVTGVFMHFWSEDPTDKMTLDDFINRCCSLESERMARSVCEALDIPFYSLNVRKEFKKAVVDYFLKELNRGWTPNPCVACNREIKFKFLLEKARGFGADFVATGHYARRRREIPSLKSQIPNKFQAPIYKLLKAGDKNKDQSYFLYSITQNQLAHYLFPIGNYLKTEVRQMARKFNLSTWDRPESQEICFILDNDLRRFLTEHLKMKPGKIVDISGKIIGVHLGLPLFTVGQRHGLGIGGGKPYYAVAMDYKKNHLIATSNPNDERLFRKSLVVEDVNWIDGKAPKMPLKCEATIRYRHKPEKAIVNLKSKDKYAVDFSKPQRAITPGQSVVFYRSDEVLGGGIIS